MTTSGAFDNGVQFVWDSTSIGVAETCPRKYYYQMILNRRPLRTSVHLIFGGEYAYALESYYKHKANGADHDESLLRVVKTAFIRTWDSEAGRAAAFDHSAKTRFTLIRSIVWYLEQFGEEKSGPETVILESGKPAVELSFKFEIDDIMLSGHLDRVVNFGGGKFVMDQKTTGSTIAPYYFDQYSPNTQMSLYAMAGQIIFKSPIKGVIIDAAQIAVSFTKFARGITYRTADQLAEWWESAKETIHRTQSYSERGREADFPMNTSACGNYGGCPFRVVCSQSPKIRPTILRSEFREEIWDPTEDR